MELLTKTIKRKANDRNRLLTWINTSIWLFVFSFLVILGLETYYRNICYGDADTIYIAGPLTWFVGIFLVVEIYRRKKASDGFRGWLLSKNNEFQERLFISDEYIEYGVNDYFTSILYWNALNSFKEHRTNIEISLSTVKVLIYKTDLSPEEIKIILELLKNKKSQNEEK